MASYYALSSDVVAIEPNAVIVDSMQNDNFEQIFGDIGDLQKFKYGYFDIILCHNVLEYTADREKIMKDFQE